MRVEQIGSATLYLGDCREVAPSADGTVIVADMPYGIPQQAGGTISRSRKARVYRSFDDSIDSVADLVRGYLAPAIVLAKRAVITPGRARAYLYPAPDDEGVFFQPAAVGMSFWGRGTSQPILFYGRDPRIGKTIQPLHYTLTEKPESIDHPCPKPIKAWTWLVNRAAVAGDTVFDPVMGSGTTGVACADLGLPFIGCEIDPGYFDTACKRIEQAHRQQHLFAA